MNGVLAMRKLEEESSSGLEEPDADQIWNIMHAFWLRFSVALGTTFVCGVLYVRMSMYGATTSMTWMLVSSALISAIAWISSSRQLYLDSFYSGGLNSLSEDILLGKDKPW